MNGKLIVRLVESALSGKLEQVKIIANILSSELRATDPESSKQLSKMIGNSLRSAPERINPHLIKGEENNTFLFNAKKNDDELNKLVLCSQNKEALSQVIKEHKNARKLAQHKLEPIKTLIFKGPPGVGKTLTAEWLAREMGLPIKVVNLAAIMSSLLGQSGNNLISIFKEAANIPCVLLLDEFDSLAKKRDDERDIGELKRLVTVLLQAIDHWPSTSILIAATNHAELLDPAIWRRFEIKLDFKYPQDNEIKEFLLNLTGNKKIADLSILFKGMSYSDIRNDINLMQKSVILDNKDMISQLATSFLKNGEKDNFTLEEKKNIAVQLVTANVSQRKVSEILNISRPTIKKALSE